MTRDFTEAAKQKLISQIEEVTETSWWGKVGDFFGDRWLDIQSWTGKLSIQNYLDDVDAYHKKILDRRNTKIGEIERIFSTVRSIDDDAGYSTQQVVADLQQKLTSIVRFSDIIKIPVSNFTPANITDYFDYGRSVQDFYVETHEGATVPKTHSGSFVPPKTNCEDCRSGAAYAEVMDALNVESEYRYQRSANGDTWCNVYVRDVTRAMGCEIPSGSARNMTNWLGSENGAVAGWKECTEEEAILYANSGHPTVVAATNTNHVAMVAPQHEGDSGVMLSQAGKDNFNYGSKSKAFRKSHTVKYYYHE